jgi:hypothetical protein
LRAEDVLPMSCALKILASRYVIFKPFLRFGQGDVASFLFGVWLCLLDLFYFVEVHLVAPSFSGHQLQHSRLSNHA